MGIEWADSPKHPVNSRQRSRDRAVMAVAALAMAFGLGYIAGGARVESHLVQCEEDEVWYPTDYTHNESVEDLTCIHIEVLQADD